MRNSSLSTSLQYLFCSYLHRYCSGLRLPALRLSFFFWLADILFIYTLWKENAGPLQLTYSPCLTWIVSTTPQRHAKSHHNDKCIYCLPPWPRCRPSDTLGFRCSIAIPAILLSTLSLHVTVTDSRLASNAVVNSLFDGASTHRTIYPLLDARSDPNVFHYKKLRFLSWQLNHYNLPYYTKVAMPQNLADPWQGIKFN